MKSLKIYIITSFILYFCLTGCTKINTYNISGNALGTIYYININSDKNIDINSIKKNISFIINDVNKTASNYINDSEISIFNNSHLLTFQIISSNLYNIISKSKIVSDLTNGFFDITIGDINVRKGFYKDLSNFKNEKFRNYNYKDLIISPSNLSIKKNYKNMNIDLSGIAKGYAVDLIYDYLVSLNISEFIINIGGEIRVYSPNKYTVIGIDDPSGNQQYIEEVFVKNMSLASSGTHLNTVNFDGKEISHIVNPKTLSNISNLNILVTVIHNECAIADAIATGLLAMDPKDIISFSDKNEIATFLVITNDEESKKYYSKEFINYLSAK